MTFQRMMDRLADTDTKLKVLVFFFLIAVLPTGFFLYLLDILSSKKVLPFAGLHLVLLLIVQFPLCGLLSNLLVIHNVSKINEYCRQIKQGNYYVDFDLPPERGEENDFLRAKRNLYWMGQIIALREEKLVATLDALNIARKKVMESIEYASRIQHTLLPPITVLDGAFEDHFVWWEPRDVVGGDTYWAAETRSGIFVAAIDCTGHGVPGAFMTLIVHTLLDQCIRSDFSDNPARVLAHLNRRLKSFLHRSDGSDRIDDGFDAAVCHIGARRNRLVFAGAGLPLYFESGGEILDIKGDRAGVGDARAPFDMCYTNHTLDLTKTSRFYLATDGLTDQIGGPKRLPFGRKRFKSVLSRVSTMPFAEQKKELSTAWRSYLGDEEKRDDLTVLGFSPSPS